MDQIPIRALNQNTAEVLARVEHGETVEVTNRGRPIARIVPITTDALSDLVAAGTVAPATISGPIPMPTTPAEPGSEAGALLSELREEERW
ncbi:type II toxin-antitoxin system Phd/YefM family antitoxin [Phytohabitans rumicis]|uniref:Antitoxin n=1 Tax=Phytohabitans rumicis TaxID=1076125 RepID=A0A6V8LB21_9ACTN|nr:type II toxin-antitoxin system Phd/YefM family antitoxin [Phytohabitans rumicis]GFJ91739.1 antitoxin VapB46 [Phytohabitans rumicis]